ncbi:hypothetical protein AAZX31_19G178700 [Glycine max]
MAAPFLDHRKPANLPLHQFSIRRRNKLEDFSGNYLCSTYQVSTQNLKYITLCLHRIFVHAFKKEYWFSQI